MAEDVSKNTVVVLLILTIIISVVGTLVVLEEASRIRSENSEFSAQEQSPQLGIIKVNVQKRPAEFGASAEENAEETE